MMVDALNLNQVVMSKSAVVLMMVSLHEQINNFPGTSYAAADLLNSFFSIPVLKAHQKQCIFSWQVSSTPCCPNSGLCYLSSLV